MSARTIHEPTTLAPNELAEAGVVIGEPFPAPIIDHGEARRRDPAAYGAVTRR